MKYILKNIRSFIRSEKIIFTVLIVCVMTSAFVLNFSYGLFYNYSKEYDDAQTELKELSFGVSYGKTLTKGEFQAFAEAFSYELQDQIGLIMCTADLTRRENNDRYFYFPMRFKLKNGEYYTPRECVVQLWEENHQIISGHYISDEDERAGAFSAVTYCESDKNVGDTVEFLGNTYTVVGTYKSYGHCPLVPFLTVPDDVELISGEGGCLIEFYDVMTRRAYNEIKAAAEQTAPGKLTFPELDLPDDDTFALYRNIIIVSVLIAGLTAMNFASLYLFIMRKRKRSLAVMQLVGAARLKTAGFYLGECVFITVPSFAAGTIIFDLLLKNVFANIFEFMPDAFDPLAYLAIFGVYMIITLIAVSVLIIKNVRVDLKQTLSEGRI